MTGTITYSLISGGRDSAEYHRTIAAFADRWLTATLPLISDLAADFQSYLRDSGQTLRSEAEIAFEILVLGVLLREQDSRGAFLPARYLRLLERLVGLQTAWPRFDRNIKACRGLMFGISPWLRFPQPGTDDVHHLIAWLRAVGEESRARRLEQWQGFLARAGESRSRQTLLRCRAVASDFAEESLLDLGKYTECVSAFLQKVAPSYRFRYDAVFVSRSRLEYHLGMLGTEILNRAYRGRFLQAGRKVVIVPPCMRAKPEGDCQATETPLGARCQACTSACRVHQVTRLGEKHGFKVFIIPDELRVFGAGTEPDDLGLLGVSCALTNWSGGWEADSLSIPAQGLLLDYVGCTYHWDKHGIPTSTNLKALQDLLGIEGERKISH
jgi:uncharacterized protein